MSFFNKNFKVNLMKYTVKPVQTKKVKVGLSILKVYFTELDRRAYNGFINCFTIEVKYTHMFKHD